MDASQYEGPYWVVGGEYADTEFTRLKPGAKETRLGPFHLYADAYAAWQAASWRHVDQCNFRFRIAEAGETGERAAA
jgi:hypothetical protein